ncbi:LexA family protein [Methylobacterium brachythecii]|uniref:DNA polymerase V n=1 Tax=Methylobacterium brachythecii TaxID=1176177 RepID=A0A7W6F662_9HYPH|nr:S24 family peptidase [Methylobacterium brachythecii]MBB3902062.1 DNA polymerase V [Methylobacterium brachythecii]
MHVVTVDQLPVDGLGSVSVPFLGQSVCAGFPSPADDFLEEALGLPRWLVPNPPAAFLWRVAGWSVVGAGIHDGDIVVVDRSVEPKQDDIVLAIIDGAASLKRYRLDGNRAVLAFDNPELPAAAIEDISEAAIWGVVTVTLRLNRPLVRLRR